MWPQFSWVEVRIPQRAGDGHELNGRCGHGRPAARGAGWALWPWAQHGSARCCSPSPRRTGVSPSFGAVPLTHLLRNSVPPGFLSWDLTVGAEGWHIGPQVPHHPTHEGGSEGGVSWDGLFTSPGSCFCSNTSTECPPRTRALSAGMARHIPPRAEDQPCVQGEESPLPARPPCHHCSSRSVTHA